MTIFSLQKKIEYILIEILNLEDLININNSPKLNIFLVQVNNKNFTKRITYKSPLCLQISKIRKENPNFIAEKLFTLWHNLDYISSLDLDIRISSNGWLEFIIGDRFLIDWLQALPQFKLPYQSQSVRENKLDFNLYYAHVRCCSILRLAHQNKLIELKSTDFNQCKWLWHKPKFIPYDCGCLKLEYEKKLIYQLIIIVDTIYAQKQSNWLKIALEFMNVILDYECYCRIFGDLKAKNPKLSQARLGLLALAQLYFQWILQDKLDATVPTEW